MFIQVTQEDIEAGVQNDTEACPIAIACKRVGLKRPEVDRIWVNAMGREKAVMPFAARQFVYDYDNNRVVAPFSFELAI